MYNKVDMNLTNSTTSNAEMPNIPTNVGIVWKNTKYRNANDTKYKKYNDI